MAPASTDKPVTFFSTQFPQSDCTELCSNVEFDPNAGPKGRYVKFNLDIGWALREGHSNRSSGSDPRTRLYDRVCCGYNACITEDCHAQLTGIEFRPKVTEKVDGDNMVKKRCKHCNKQLKRFSCPVKVYFKFTSNGCEMTHEGTHSHGRYERKHLSVEQNKQMDQFVQRYPKIPPKAATVGIDPNSRQVIQPISEIDSCLENRERAAYQMKISKQRVGLPTTETDPLALFSKIESDYPYFITAANILEQQFFISFRPPTIDTFVNFGRYPIITDVTYKAVKGCYLSSSVIYSPEIAKHVVIFQAILKGTSVLEYQQYFLHMFTTCKLDFIHPGKMFAVIMDLSQAQINGFLAAYSIYTGRNDGLSYLKGCYMHWMQSVQRISSYHNMVPPKHRKRFLKYAYKLRTTTSNQEFNLQLLAMITELPPTWKWIKWWLQPSIRSMVFNTESAMRPELRECRARTSNAIEAYLISSYCIPVST